ncbi:transglycosylase SLT domain-containing protein [Dissulfurirhabdus thermomarina]|uniref:transglycosylase SLT domain-containing protein n=1 Tax=Dissulfurirhabdus thermomarina TaxID=1765737 RepID=UPI00147061EB|nr:transglycosylase SLT domain-containing protein [Dissulfurirhabdus thermomarina]NMX24345.1 transglycosylase SLT domain-containing protein [Dissulfurirhabdus thermomarina]
MFSAIGLAALLWAWAGPAAAVPPMREAQREAFLAAEAALAAGDEAAYWRHLEGLRDYPLFPYLRYQWLRARLDRARPLEVKVFLCLYGDTPVAGDLQRAWLESLASRERWEEFLRAYDPGVADLSLDCLRRRALLHAGRAGEALDGIEEIYASAVPEPEACTPVFAAWEAAGGPGEAVKWRRIRTAMAAGRGDLALELAGGISRGARAAVAAWQEARAHPGRLAALVAGMPRGPAREWVIRDGLAALARRDPGAALAVWRRNRARWRLPAEAARAVETGIALALAADRDPAHRRDLETLAARLEDPRLVEWCVRLSLLDRDWRGVLKWTARLPAGRRSRPAWRYWRARALAALGRKGDARRIYEELARDRSYYGFLAADRAGRPYALETRPLEADPGVAAEVAALPGVQRARELLFLGRREAARREWAAAVRGLDRDHLLQAARLAHSWGWYDRAIAALGRAGCLDDLALRFPLAYLPEVSARAARADIDPAWALALMRQESAFDTRARSRSGALGLMQLMPGTARFVARRRDLPLRSLDEVFRAETNIRLGIGYLEMVRDRFGGNPVLATAAYNAGPARVEEWLPEEGPVEADLWVETIPFTETRRYVKRVLFYAAVYEARLGRRPPARLADRMPSIEPVVTLAALPAPAPALP